MLTGGLVKWVWFSHNIIICGMVVCEVSLVSTQYNNMWTGGLVKWVWLPHNIIICGLVVCEVSLVYHTI